jgi:hypothetical protein
MGKKSGNKKTSLEKIVLVTAIANLISSIVNLIDKIK